MGQRGNQRIDHSQCWICGGSGYIVTRKRSYILHKAPRVGRRPGEYVYEPVTRVITCVCPHSKSFLPRRIKTHIQRPKKLPNRHRNSKDKKQNYKNRVIGKR